MERDIRYQERYSYEDNIKFAKSTLTEKNEKLYAKLNEVLLKTQELQQKKIKTEAEIKQLNDLCVEAKQISNRIKTNDSELLSYEQKLNALCAKARERQSQKQRVARRRPIKQAFHYIQRHAFIFSLLLCLILYFSFLIFAFTEKNHVDTYICYTTKTGECYHAAYCQYLRNSSYKTTVYEAKKKYRKCSRCSPILEKYKTTIIVKERNYFFPALISIPLSAATYILLIKTNKGDDNR